VFRPSLLPPLPAAKVTCLLLRCNIKLRLSGGPERSSPVPVAGTRDSADGLHGPLSAGRAGRPTVARSPNGDGGYCNTGHHCQKMPTNLPAAAPPTCACSSRFCKDGAVFPDVLDRRFEGLATWRAAPAQHRVQNPRDRFRLCADGGMLPLRYGRRRFILPSRWRSIRGFDCLK
jgi:hypothetical protein